MWEVMTRLRRGWCRRFESSQKRWGGNQSWTQAERSRGCNGGIGSYWGRERLWVALTMEIGSSHWGGTCSVRKRVRKNKKRILGHHWWVALTMKIGSSHRGETLSMRKREGGRKRKELGHHQLMLWSCLGLVLYHHSSMTYSEVMELCFSHCL